MHLSAKNGEIMQYVSLGRMVAGLLNCCFVKGMSCVSSQEERTGLCRDLQTVGEKIGTEQVISQELLSNITTFGSPDAKDPTLHIYPMTAPLPQHLNTFNGWSY